MLRLSVPAVICLSAVAGCTSGGVDMPEAIALSPFTSSDAPLSISNHIVTLSEEIACVTDSFESQIHCVDRVGDHLTVFGGGGRGPGEFMALSGIGRGHGSHVMAMDFGEDRLTFFRPNGHLVSEIRLPSGFQSTSLRGDRLYGFRLVMPDFVEEFRPGFIPMEVSVSSGEVLWERTNLADAVDRECFNPAAGISTPDGGLVFQVCEYELAFFAHRDASNATVVASPSYVEAMPNERDVVAHMDSRVRFRRELPIIEAEMANIEAEFRAKPKEWLLKPHPFRFDDQSRLWAATTLDRDVFSYFDVWTDTTHIGAVRVRDRLMSFDIFGPIPVTSVERPPGNDGMSERGIGWYDLSKIDWSC